MFLEQSSKTQDSLERASNELNMSQLRRFNQVTAISIFPSSYVLEAKNRRHEQEQEQTHWRKSSSWRTDEGGRNRNRSRCERKEDSSVPGGPLASIGQLVRVRGQRPALPSSLLQYSTVQYFPID